jgi:class 3 adenylate cyclase
LILANTSTRLLRDDDYPWGHPEADLEAAADFLTEVWATEAVADFSDPAASENPAYRRWFAKMQRATCSPREAAGFMRITQRIDVRHVLPALQIPTLVLHRKDVGWITPDMGRYLAEHIHGARFELVPGGALPIFVEPTEEIAQYIEEFLTGTPTMKESDRALAAVLFTDIVGSTEQAASIGDRRWRELLESHDAVSRTIVDQCRGKLVKLTGDGVLATFDGPGRAIRCALALRHALDAIGVEIRAGLHVGEVEFRGDDIGGIGVHVAARVLDHARARELLVSAAVPLLVTGSGVEFTDRGEHELKGVPSTWRLYAVSA